MSVITQGLFGSPFSSLPQGYGASVLPPPREVFVVSPLGSSVAYRANGLQTPVEIGSTEAGDSYGIDFTSCLRQGETILSVAATAQAHPMVPPSTPYDASSATLQGTAPDGNVAVVSLHNATIETAYVVTLSVSTTASRTLECQLPRLYCFE